MIKPLLRTALFCILGLCSSVTAQNQKFGIPEIENFYRKQYGGAPQNWKITQGESDLLYFANNNGLLEFDGARWNLYTDFGHNPVRSVKSIGNRIYCGSFNELGYYSYNRNNAFKYTSLTSSRTSKLGDFWDIFEWNDFVVFQSEKALCFFKDGNLETVVPSNSRFISAFNADGLLLVHDEHDGLLELRGNRLFPVAGGDIFKGKFISAIIRLSNEELIIGTKTDGLFIWNMSSVKEWNISANDFLKKLNVFCGIEYDDDHLAFGTVQGGLVVTDKKGNVVTALDKTKGIKNNTILSLYADTEGNIWCGMDNGIAKVNFNSNISFLQGYYDIGTGYVATEYQSNFYFGTNQGLYRISKTRFSDPQKKSDDFFFIPQASGQVWSLYSDDLGLLCGHNKGIINVSGDKAEIISPLGVSGAWIFKNIEGHPELLLVGTYNGLIILEKRKGTWAFRNRVEGFSESSRFLEWDNQGALWMSHGDIGAYKIKLKDDFSAVEEVDTFKLIDFPGNKDGAAIILSKVRGQCIFNSVHGIYSTSDAGPVRLKMLETFFEEGNYPNKLIEDIYNNVWFFFRDNTGVLRIQEDGSYIKVEAPFIPIAEKQVGSFENVYVMNRRNSFFGVEDGFAHYKVEENISFNKSFKVHIRSFKCLNDTLEYGLNQTNDSVKQTVPVKEYAYKDNSFHVDYAASYYEDNEILYSSFLSNFDDEPLEWSELTSRQLLKLHEGEYTFTVKAKNRNNVISESLALTFVVKPPFLRSSFAKWAYALLMLILIYLLYWIINRRIEMNKQKEILSQQELFRNQEEQLKRDALANEKEVIRLRNDKLRSDISYKEKELANSTMNIIQKNDFLLRLKNQLKGFLEGGDRDELKRKVKQLVKEIDKDIDSKSYWEIFEVHLAQVHSDFLERLTEKHPELSGKEQKLCAYVRMGMSSKEIASLMNISARAVENNRYFLRQKLSLEKGQNLIAYIESL